MNGVQEISMPAYEARRAAAHYLKQVRLRHSKEDQEILAGYRALSRGKRIISLRAAMIGAGFTPEGYPKLAITRADQKRVHVNVERWNRNVTFIPEGRSFFETRMAREFRFTFRGIGPELREQLRAWAFVPIVPAGLRPESPLCDYHILFEAEWRPVPPKDPILLKRLGQDLFAVVAHWNLTEVERAVIGAMR
jgi:hypothetical protein